MNPKKGHGWSGRVLIKYTLIQIPGLVALIFVLVLIKRWVELPLWTTLGVIVLWMLKDAILFPFVWKAYDSGPYDDPLSMIGEQGVAQERLNPSGYALLRGELWKAEVMDGQPAIEEGAAVWVREMRGLKLIVEEDPDAKGGV